MIFMVGNVILIGVLLVVWNIVSHGVGPLILPTPIDVYSSFKENIFTIDGFIATKNTLYRFLSTYFVSVFLGSILGFVTFRFKKIRVIVWPILTILQGTPIISWILLALLWFSSERIPYFILYIFILPIITINIYEGLRATDRKILEMARVYKVDELNIIKKIYIPSTLPYLRAAMKIGLNASLKVLVTAEIIGRLPIGIGSKINESWMYIDVSSLLAWTIYLIVLTIILEKAIINSVNYSFRRYL